MPELTPIDGQGQADEPSDEEIRAGIAAKAALVGPILAEFMQHANDNTDYWLKKASLRILGEWIMSLQDVATLMEQQIESLTEVLGAQEKELEELRPEKKQIWTPFS
jgi:hypothetical protein